MIKDSYSATLFVASNSNLKEKGIILPLGLIRRKPTLVPSLEYDPSKKHFHTPSVCSSVFTLAEASCL